MHAHLHQLVTGRPRPLPVHGLRALALLLSYPNAQLRQHLPELREALHAEGGLSAARLTGLDRLIDQLERDDAYDTEAAYVELFDRGRATSLHLFEHVHGDSRDRGPAMVDLIQTYEQAGLRLAGQQANELPDYLPLVLEFTSTLSPDTAHGFVGEFAHILQALHGALLKRHSAYAHIPAAVLEWMGQPVTAAEAPISAPEEPMDEAWAEPPAFNGCSPAPMPNTPQPIQIVRSRGAAPHPSRGA